MRESKGHHTPRELNGKRINRSTNRFFASTFFQTDNLLGIIAVLIVLLTDLRISIDCFAFFANCRINVDILHYFTQTKRYGANGRIIIRNQINKDKSQTKTFKTQKHVFVVMATKKKVI